MHTNYIFDLYGTLVDISTNEGKIFLWRKMKIWFGMNGVNYIKSTDIKKRYFELVNEHEKKAGYPNAEIKIEEVFKEMFLEKNVEITDELAATTARVFRMISMDFVTPYEGVIDTLKALKKAGKKIYILSNAQSVFTADEVKMVGLYELFDGVIYSSDTGYKKPAGEFFDVIFKKYNLKKEESIYIGNDQNTDIKGADDYGIDSLYIYTSISPKRPSQGQLPKSCTEIKNFTEVLNY